MRHQSSKKILSLRCDQRRALLRSLAQSLILQEKLTTTETKAKTIKPIVEKMITRAKKQDISAIRLLRRSLSEVAVKKLMKMAQRYVLRPGGYLHLVKLPARLQDAAPQALITFVE